MTLYSKAALRNSALEEIKVKDADADAGASDSAMADDEIQRLIEYLADESLLIFDASVASTVENIPGRIFNALRDLCAEVLAPKFSVDTRTVAGPTGPESLYKNAERRLRRSVLDGSDDTPVKACYF